MAASNPKKRKRRRPAARRRTSRRRARRNAPRARRFTATGVFQRIGTGLMDAGLVTTGKLGTRVAWQQIEAFRTRSGATPFTGWTRGAFETLTALGVGFLSDMALGAGPTKMILAGAFTAPLETFVEQLNIPIISSALQGVGRPYRFRVVRDGNGRSAVASMGSYVRPGRKALAGVGSYVQPGNGRRRSSLSAIPVAVRTGPSAELGYHYEGYSTPED